MSDSILENSQPKLPIHEWMAVVFILFCLFGLIFLTILGGSEEVLSNPEGLNPHFLVDQEVEVSIEGAVNKAGTYRLKKGTTIREAIDQAILLPEADLQSLKLDKPIRKNQIIKVPSIEKITVHIQGTGVESFETLVLPKKTHLSDLKEKIKFKENANLKKLKKKRYLKDGEVITIDLAD